MPTTAPIGEVMKEMVANTGESVYDLSLRYPLLLVFLRHFGCVFCREALTDISEKRRAIEEKGVRIVFVHMAENEIAEKYFQKYEIGDAVHVSDPACRYYASFGLTKGNFTQLYGLQVWMRGFATGILDGYGTGPQLGDGFQMPGIFVLQDGEVREKFIHKLSSDRPDYEMLANCCTV